MPKFVLLWTDAAIWLLVLALVAYVWRGAAPPGLRANWRKVFRDARGAVRRRWCCCCAWR